MIDENKGQETKICNKCGRELPIEKYELMKPDSNKPYRLNTCKDCRYKYMRERIEKRREVKLSDNIQILIHRSYKKINPERILDLSKIDIQPLEEDEILYSSPSSKREIVNSLESTSPS